MPRYFAVNAKVQLCAVSLGPSTTANPTTRKGPKQVNNAQAAEDVLRSAHALAETVVDIPPEDGKPGGRLEFIGNRGMPFMMVHAGEGLFGNTGGAQETPTRRTSDRTAHASEANGIIQKTPPIRRVSRQSVSSAGTTPQLSPSDDKAKDKAGAQDDTRSVSTAGLARLPMRGLSTAAPNIDLAPQALCVQVTVSPDTFLYDPAVHVGDLHNDLKLEVFFNGHFANALLMPGRDRQRWNRPISQLFSGERFHYLLERPWIIVPPGQEVDGSLRGTIHKSAAVSRVTANERWGQIGAALLAEADIRGLNEHGQRPPSGEFLECLANMRMPSVVEGMQKPGGPKFGVIDVLVSAGQGSKDTAKAPYIQAPARFVDDLYKTAIKEKEAEKEATRNVVDLTGDDSGKSDPQPTPPEQPQPQRTPNLASGFVFQTPAKPLCASSPPTFLRGFLPSSSFSDYYSSPDDGRHQMSMGSLGSKDAVDSQSANVHGPASASSERRTSLPIPFTNVTLRSRQNSLSQSANPALLMPPPPAPPSAMNPKKRRRDSAPTLDGTPKRLRVSERITPVRPTVEPLTPVRMNTPPPSSVGISRRGVFTGIGSPTAIPEMTFPKTSGSPRGGNPIVIEHDPFAPRIQLPVFNNPFSGPVSLPLGLSGIRTGGYGIPPGFGTPRSLNIDQQTLRPSVIINRIVIKENQKTIIDKSLKVGYRLALSTPNSNAPRQSTPPPRRSSRIQRSETPGSAAYGEPSPKSTIARRSSINDPGTPPSSSPLKKASAAQRRGSVGGRVRPSRAKPSLGNVPRGNVPTPTYLLSQIRSRQDSDMSAAESAKIDQVVMDVAKHTSPNAWGLMEQTDQASAELPLQTNQGVGAPPQQLGSGFGSRLPGSSLLTGLSTDESELRLLAQAAKAIDPFGMSPVDPALQTADAGTQRSMMPRSRSLAHQSDLQQLPRGLQGIVSVGQIKQAGLTMKQVTPTRFHFRTPDGKLIKHSEIPKLVERSLARQSTLPSSAGGSTQPKPRTDSLQQMKRSDTQDTIQVRPRVASAPAVSAGALSTLTGNSMTTPVPKGLVQTHRESLGSFSIATDSPLSSVPSQMSTPKDLGHNPPTQANGKDNEKPKHTEGIKLANSQSEANTPASTTKTHGQGSTNNAAFLSQDCVITYAQAAPTAPEIVRQVRATKAGVFHEDEIVFGVRFLLG